MNLGFFVLITLLGGIAYFLIFRSPPSDQICSHSSESEIARLQRLLEDQGIKTYVKNLVARQYVKSGQAPMGQPSLHVVNVRELPKAIEIVNKAC